MLIFLFTIIDIAESFRFLGRPTLVGKALSRNFLFSFYRAAWNADAV